MRKEGERVGALLGSDETSIDFLGYGVYDGDYIPKEAVGFMAEILKRSGRENPRITLDNGGVVYGCECWWAGEEKVQKLLQTYKENGLEIKMVRIDDVRAKIKAQKDSGDESNNS